MKGARQVTISETTASNKYQWRVVDIVVASVIGVASGVIFWAWGLLWNVASIPLAVLPGFVGILGGGWLFAGVIGGLVVRKPGAALYTELLAAFVSMVIGSQWGWTTMISGLAQGIGVEIVFAIFLYRTWKWWVAMLAGAGAAVGLLFNDLIFSYALTDALFKSIYVVSSLISGAVIGGLLSWFAVSGLAKTGALSRFAAGRDVVQQV
jgi:energy-coupling factor transport system permease protein